MILSLIGRVTNNDMVFNLSIESPETDDRVIIDLNEEQYKLITEIMMQENCVSVFENRSQCTVNLSTSK